MFWRFGLNHSAIDGLLDKEDLTLEELLDEEDLLQECKAHNNNLRDPVILFQLLNYIIRDDLDERQKFKYPFVACEVLSCEIWTICEAIIDNGDLLNSFWQVLDREPPLNPLQASYFMKVNVVLLQKKMSEKMLNHMETSAIMDLLLKLISVEEYPEGAGIIDWLNSEGLVEELISRLNPYLEPDAHSTTAQIISDIIAISQSSSPEQGGVGPNALSRELISDYNEEAMLSLSPHQHQHQYPAVDLSDMLKVLANRVDDFKALLENPKSVSGQIDTTIGKMVPLGFERFRICELFAELLHCSNMDDDYQDQDHEFSHNISHDKQTNILNILDENNQNIQKSQIEVENQDDNQNNDQNNVENVDQNSDKNGDQNGDKNVDENNNDENNYQNNVENVQKVENKKDTNHTDSCSVSSVSSPMSMEIVENIKTPPGLEHMVQQLNKSNGSTNSQLPVGDILKAKFIEYKIIPTCLWNNFLHTVVYDMIVQIFNGRMDIGYNKSLAISVFTDGQLTKRITNAQRLNDYEVQPKGVRLGYMGHLTFIAEEVVKLLDRYAVEIGEKAEDWQEYVSKTLRETRDRDREPLGGQRPTNLDSMSPSRDESEEEEEEDDAIEGVTDGDMASDQFDRDADFEMHGAFMNQNMLEGDPFENRRSAVDNFVDSDDDDSSSQWTLPNHQNHQERKQLLTIADWSADFQSGYKINQNSNISANDQSSSTTPNITISQSIPSKETNVQQTRTFSKSIQDDTEKDNDVKESTEKSSIPVNSHLHESLDNTNLVDLQHTNFDTFDKIGINLDNNDNLNDDQKVRDDNQLEIHQ
ncbi:11860_t:CDS:10 [Diversispora eburnea]|uniref:11860_t:CDS:1 n=1 Tax=Diversispora eburnea TaxID=1213867 RepID=A0A9N8V9N1_9GLOM|nr:11860_t:CDS:10 [Diversispora eburnea]